MKPQPDNLKSWYKSQGCTIAGLDEAGRGPLAGPVVAAAVVLDPRDRLKGLADSKILSAEKRERLFDIIHERALALGLAVVSPRRIDQINILQASLEAMRLAFEEAELKCGRQILGALVDGNQRAPLPLHVQQHTVVDGDNIWRPIMAASIIAKVHRDRLMQQEALKYPVYGFDKHKGYATPQHYDALIKHGPCDIHRRSFAPVAERLMLSLPLIER